MSFCHKCGANVPDGSDFCSKCGAKLVSDEAVPAEKSRPPEVRNDETNASDAFKSRQEYDNGANSSGGGKSDNKTARIIKGILIGLIVGAISAVAFNVSWDNAEKSSHRQLY